MSIWDRQEDGDGAPGLLGSLVRYVVVLGVAGLAAGVLVGGIGVRLFMRVAAAIASPLAQGAITEAGARVGQVTLDGSMGLMIFAALTTCIVGAVSRGIFAPWLAWAGRYKGLALGVVLFAVFSATSDMLNVDNPDFFILGNHGAVVGMIVVLFILFGVVFEWAFGRFDRWLPAFDTSASVKRVYGALSAFGSLLAIAVGVPLLFFSPGLCDCERSLWTAIFTGVTMVGTALWWACQISPRMSRLVKVGPVVGYVGLVGATGFGLVRAISDAVEVIS